MTREEAKAILYEWQKMMVRNGVPLDTSKVQALRVAIEALSADGDLIRRADAIRALEREKSDWNCDYNVPIDNCIKSLNKVRPADRPTGKWIKRGGKISCGNCKSAWTTSFDTIIVGMNFCPHCGADMRGGGE